MRRSQCVAAVRMSYDFSPTSLPTLGGNFYRTDTPKVTQVAQWSDLIYMLDELQTMCVVGLIQPAWAVIGDIVVALWPAGSVIDQKEGLNMTKGSEEGELRVRDEEEDEEWDVEREPRFRDAEGEEEWV